MNTSSAPLAKCYLKDEGDENNYCLLSENTLLVNYNGKRDPFFIHWVKNITFQKRIFLMPIIFGGITASLAGVGLFQYYLNPWVMLAILFSSGLVIYYGIQGSMALTIVTPIKEYDFFVNSVSDNLKAFAAFSMSTINGTEVKFYFTQTISEYQLIENKGYLHPPESGLRLHTEIKTLDNESVLLEIVTKNLPFEIKYRKVNDGSLSPFIFDKIPIDYINRSKRM